MHPLRSVPALAGPALLALGLLLAAAPAPAQPIECGTRYTVQPGDTLGKIAARLDIGPPAWAIDLILRANEETIASADLIRVGDVLFIPCGGDMATGSEAMASAARGVRVVERPAMARRSPAAASSNAFGLIPAAEPVVDGRASRIFSGPGQFPPRAFGGYAIVAFKSAPLEADEAEFGRYRAICEAYVRAIPEASDELEQQRQELVTVWPMSTDESADHAMQAPRDEQCEIAADNYGIGMAHEALRDAKRAAGALADDFGERDGPFLLAWNPAAKKGDPDALILRMDLSWVRTAAQARQAFEFWVQRIETNTDLWLDDWERRPIDQIVADTADTWGQAIIDSIGFIVGRAE